MNAFMAKFQEASRPRAIWQITTTLFLVAPLYHFLILQQLPSASASARERPSVWWMNLAIVVIASGMSLIYGLKNYVVIQLIVMGVAASLGVWLFYVQHQFESVYWERERKLVSFGHLRTIKH